MPLASLFACFARCLRTDQSAEEPSNPSGAGPSPVPEFHAVWQPVRHLLISRFTLVYFIEAWLIRMTRWLTKELVELFTFVFFYLVRYFPVIMRMPFFHFLMVRNQTRAPKTDSYFHKKRSLLRLLNASLELIYS